MVYWKNNSVSCLKKQNVQEVLPVKYCCRSRMSSGQCRIPFRYCSYPCCSTAIGFSSSYHVNGGVCNIPSAAVKAGDVVAVREKSKALEVVADSLRSNRVSKYSWLEWDGASMSGKLLNVPERSDIPENIKEQLIVELYLSKKN